MGEEGGGRGAEADKDGGAVEGGCGAIAGDTALSSV